MMMDDSPLKTWEEFWKPAFEKHGKLTEDGLPTLKAIQDELSDYYYILNQVPKVYSEVTGGMLSKPNYEARTVIAYFEEYVQRLRQEAIEDYKEENGIEDD